jgi:hypothetical protein
MGIVTFFRKLTKTNKNRKMINLTRKQKTKVRRIRIKELSGQFPKFDAKNDVFTIEITSCKKKPSYQDEEGRCNIKWIRVPEKCCKWNIPKVYEYMTKNRKSPYNYWFLGDGDYKVIFL